MVITHILLLIHLRDDLTFVKTNQQIFAASAVKKPIFLWNKIYHLPLNLFDRHVGISFRESRLLVRRSIFGDGYSAQHIRLLCRHVSSEEVVDNHTSASLFQLRRILSSNSIHDDRCLFAESYRQYSLHYNCCWPRRFCLVRIFVSSSWTLCVSVCVCCDCVIKSIFFVFRVNHLDIAPQHASVLMGISNTFATVPGIVSPALTGYIVQNSVSHLKSYQNIQLIDWLNRFCLLQTAEEWRTVFIISSCIYLVGCVIYWNWASGEVQPWAKPQETSPLQQNSQSKKNGYTNEAIELKEWVQLKEEKKTFAVENKAKKCLLVRDAIIKVIYKSLLFCRFHCGIRVMYVCVMYICGCEWNRIELHISGWLNIE